MASGLRFLMPDERFGNFRRLCSSIHFIRSDFQLLSRRSQQI